jgi:hypothetical protein
MASAAKEQQQQQQESSSRQSTSNRAAAGSTSDCSSSQQPAAEPLRATGAFTGTAAQSRPIPLHVLEQEYDMVHQASAAGTKRSKSTALLAW